MRLPIVATVATIASMTLAAALPAVELSPGSGLTLNGYGEAFTEVGNRQANNPHNTTFGTPGARDETYIDFPSDLTLKIGYAYEDFVLRSDVIFASRDQYDGDNVLLEQCFIDWKADPLVTIRAGRFQNTWLGWEGFHTPELWRVNHSAAWEWNVQNHGLAPARPFLSDGIGAMFSVPDKPITAGVFVVDDVLGDGPGQRPADKAVGASVAWKPPGVGRFELGMAFDPKAVNNGSANTSDNAFAIDVNADITAFKSQGWFFAGEIQVHRHPTLTIAGEHYGNDLVALAMANYRFDPRVSGTFMIDYVERGFAAGSNEVIEFAVAVLTKPRKQVMLNGEIFYWNETANKADTVGAAAVLLLMLP